MFEKLSNYHPKIKLTIEFSPTRFLNTGLHLSNGIYDFKVYRKTTKQPKHWSSKVPKRYKRNMILMKEIRFISHKYEKAYYPKRFINSVIRQFQDRSNQSNIDDFDDYIIPPNCFIVLLKTVLK